MIGNVKVRDVIDNVKVRDALYEAWHAGNLKARVDDNGQPLTIPPIKRSDYEVELSPVELLDVNYFCFLVKVPNRQKFIPFDIL